VLFAVASADPQVIARKLRFTLRVSAVIGLAGMAALGLGAHLTLSLFGAGYAREATVTLWLLVIGYVPTVPKMHYIAVCRAAGRIPRAAAVLTTAAGVEVAAAVIGGRADGLDGLSLALVAVFFLEGLVTTPPVVRAAIGRGRHRRPDLAARTAGSTQKPSEPRPAQLPSSAGGGPVYKRSGEQSPRWRGDGPAQPAAAAPASRTDIWFPAEQDYWQRQESGVANLLALARAQPAPPPPRPARAQPPPPPPRPARAQPAPPSPPAVPPNGPAQRRGPPQR